MRVMPSRSRKVIWAAERRGAGGGREAGKERKMKVEGWRVGVRVARRWGREREPGAGAVEDIWVGLDGWLWFGEGVFDFICWGGSGSRRIILSSHAP